MAANFNRVILAGNLTRDPQLRYLPSNTAVCEFGLATNRRYRDRDGNTKEEVCFVDISAWGRQGEVINQYMTKGRSILIEGRLKFDSWTAQDGQKRNKLTVVAENFQFIGGGRDGNGGGDRGGRPEPGPADDRGGDYGGPSDAGPPGPDDIPF
jgi:single-strand DNA-binding protein